MGRKSIYEQPMTAAQRKERSRANIIGHIDAQLDIAERHASDWRRCVQNGMPGATTKDIEDAFSELALMIAKARLSLPRS